MSEKCKKLTISSKLNTQYLVIARVYTNNDKLLKTKTKKRTSITNF